MKQIVFYILFIACIYIGYKILSILLYDITRLTEYGYGYLTGQIVLFIGVGFITYKLRPKI